MDNDIFKVIPEFLSKMQNPKSYVLGLKRNIELYNMVLEYQKLIKAASIPETLYCIVHNVMPIKCACGNKALFNTFNKGYRSVCAFDCPEKGKNHQYKLKKIWKDTDAYSNMLEKREETCLQKYGNKIAAVTQSVIDKTKTTNIQRYGTPYPLQSPEIQNKVKETIKSKYGVEYPFQSEDIRNKASMMFEQNHGKKNDMLIPREVFSQNNEGKNPFEIESVKNRSKQSFIDKYGVEHALQNPKFLKKSQQTSMNNHGRANGAQLHYTDEAYAFLTDKSRFQDELNNNNVMSICEKYGILRPTLYKWHHRHGLDILKTRIKSSYEEEIAKILTDLNITFIRNYNKLCHPRQVDFYIPDHALAIEFNGLYWHSEISGKKDKTYHASKAELCKENGIQLLTIFEDEWINRHETIINHVKHLCGITDTVVGARKVIITTESMNNEIRNFLNDHHIQGKASMVSYVLAGRVDGRLVAAMTLHSCAVGTGEYDINRFCTDTKASYPGLFSKFLKYIERNLPTVSFLTTIADLRWSHGDVYFKSGFSLIGCIKPDYHYTDYQKREHKFTYRKNNIRKKFNIDITGKTEKELMESLGYDRIWDCGKLKFGKKIR
jgi:hypothetical protein